MNNIDSRVLILLNSSSKDEVEYAFNMIFKEYSTLVYYVSLKVVKDKEIAKQITNEAFLKFFNSRKDIKKLSSIKSYLTTISKNLSINHVYSSNKIERLDKEVSVTYKYNDDYECYIDKFKEFLNDEELEIVIYHLIYEYTFKEIAKLKDVSINVISSKYKRALDKAKKHYKES